MQRGVAVLLMLAGCGRIGFDAATNDSSNDGAGPGRSLVLPAGGQMKQVAIGPDGTWYALSDTGGAFRSTDAGATWMRCGEHIGGGIAVTSDNVVWIAGADVARSSDHCATWQNTGSPNRAENVFADGMNVYALCDIGLERWMGGSWQTITTPFDGARFFKMARGSQRYFIATNVGMLISNNGSTWSSTQTGFGDLWIQDVVAGTTRTYAISLGAPGGISCSDSTGATWSVCFPTGGFSLFVDPANDSRVLAGIYDDMAITTNAFGGVNLGVREAANMDHALIHGMTAAPDGSVVIASDRGLFQTTPPGALTTTPRNTGLDAWDIDRITVHGGDMILSTRGGPLYSQDGGPFAISTDGIMSNTSVFDAAVAPDGTLFVAGRDLYTSKDRGATYQLAYVGSVDDGYRFHSIAFDGPRAIMGSQNRVLTSDPPYTTWTPHNVVAGNRDVIAIHPTPGRLLIGTTLGVYESMDNAASFQPVTAIDATRAHDFLDLADGSVIVATSAGVWKSDASRTTWSRAGLDGMYVDGLAASGTTLYAATSAGVYFMRGTTWSPVPGAETLAASDLVVENGALIIGSDSRGLVRVPLP